LCWFSWKRFFPILSNFFTHFQIFHPNQKTFAIIPPNHIEPCSPTPHTPPPTTLGAAIHDYTLRPCSAWIVVHTSIQYFYNIDSVGVGTGRISANFRSTKFWELGVEGYNFWMVKEDNRILYFIVCKVQEKLNLKPN